MRYDAVLRVLYSASEVLFLLIRTSFPVGEDIGNEEVFTITFGLAKQHLRFGAKIAPVLRDAQGLSVVAFVPQRSLFPVVCLYVKWLRGLIWLLNSSSVLQN